MLIRLQTTLNSLVKELSPVQHQAMTRSDMVFFHQRDFHEMEIVSNICITWSVTISYYIKLDNDKCKIWIRLLIQNRHPIACPHRWASCRVSFESILEKTDHAIKRFDCSLLYIHKGVIQMLSKCLPFVQSWENPFVLVQKCLFPILYSVVFLKYDFMDQNWDGKRQLSIQ